MRISRRMIAAVGFRCRHKSDPYSSSFLNRTDQRRVNLGFYSMNVGFTELIREHR